MPIDCHGMPGQSIVVYNDGANTIPRLIFSPAWFIFSGTAGSPITLAAVST